MATRARQTVSLGASYVLGTFNDNFYKQAGLLLAVAVGDAGFQGWATFLFALPFVLGSAAAGWLADRYAKKTLIVWAKVVEVVAACVGLWAMVAGSWAGMLGMVCAMGVNSTLFSPALNGSIPELYPAAEVPRVNALFKLTTTMSILLGVALGGVALDQKWWNTEWNFGRGLVGATALAVAVLGLISTWFIPWRAGLGSRARFPAWGFADSLRHLWELRKDGGLYLTLWAEPFFYFLSTLVLLQINRLGVGGLGYSFSLTSGLSVALMAGVCAGSLLAARGTPESWRVLMLPALLLVGLSLVAAGQVILLPEGLRLGWLLGWYGLAGVGGGLYLIPLASYVQVRPGAKEKGKVLAISNCLSFMGILLAGQIAYGLAMVDAAWCHVLAGLGTWGVMLVLGVMKGRLPQAGQVGLSARLMQKMLGPVLGLRYKVKAEGQELLKKLDERPVLVLPSHSALVDPLVLYRLLGDYCPRPISDARRTGSVATRLLLKPFKPVRIPDMGQDGRGGALAMRRALELSAEALEQGDSIMIYPSGQLTRDGADHVGNHKGAYYLYSKVPQCRVVLARVRGLWGSSFSYAEGVPLFVKALRQGLCRLLLNALFFMPRRRVRVTFAEYTPRAGCTAGEFNAGLEAFYQAEPQPVLRVPYYFWKD